MAPAYTWSRKPPKNLKPGPNVGITLCTIECDFNRPIAELSTPKNKAFAEDIISWNKIAPKIYIWDYTTDFNHYLMPFPNLDSLVPNIQSLVAHGVKGVLSRAATIPRARSLTPCACGSSARRSGIRKKPTAPPSLRSSPPATTALRLLLSKATSTSCMHRAGRTPAMAATCYSQLDSEWLAPEVIAAADAALRGPELAVKDQPELFRSRPARPPADLVYTAQAWPPK